jgi:4-carboxymuconolactone decarboxylase
MSRIPYVKPESADGAVRETFSEIAVVRGEVANLFRVIANCPSALAPVFGLSHFVRDESSLPPRLRELAILTTALTLDVPYEIAHHTEAARHAGINQGEIDALRARDDRPFDPTERAVVGYARSVAVDRHVDDAVFGELRAAFAQEQIVEIAVIVAWYHFVAAILQPLEVDLEARRAHRARPS